MQTAGAKARAMGDQYISTDHLLLGILSVDDEASKLLKAQNITDKQIDALIASSRQGKPLDSNNPESSREALGKYGRDLTELARS
jgi:ATP-dependent Clp protease ATP-binding subunit ClpB